MLSDAWVPSFLIHPIFAPPQIRFGKYLTPAYDALENRSEAEIRSWRAGPTPVPQYAVRPFVPPFLRRFF